MSNIKRIGIVLLVVTVFVVIGASFKGSNILDRCIILGLGVDGDEDEITLTAEVVAPGNGTEQVGTFSKTVTVKGKTIAEAIQNVAEHTGKEASLGQCVMIVFGQQYYEKVDLSDTIEYLVNHHSLKESSVICCCEGDAQDLYNNMDALSQSVSLSVSGSLLDEAQKIAVKTNNLLEYARSQRELHCTGYLNKVKFVPSDNKDSNAPDKTQGFFTYREIAVFRQNKYVCALTEEEVQGMALFVKDVVGETFVVEQDGMKRTLQVSHKSLDFKPVNGGLEIKIKLEVRYGRTDSEEVSGALAAKRDKEIDTKLLQQVQKQAQALAERYIDKQAEQDFDLLKFHEIYRQKEGTNAKLAAKPTADFPVKLTVEVVED